ncbi:MAG: ribonuclease H-like domain-containing protein [Hungatella sp.]|nr:ribonuclease H-like domain-containing protein [Hungatella sp.]
MITIEKPLSLPDTYPLDRLGPLEKLLFFDIETTGLSGDYSSLYLIGCTFYRQGFWHLIQWFADTADSEEQLLSSFFHFLKDFDTVIHYNGDGFDIPYLLKRCRAFNLPWDFSQVTSIDLYKRIRPYRKLLNLENLKQKSIERFLGINREDTYSGGELIQIYEDYLKTHEDSLYDMLMLHNREDLEGMPLILPILNYPDFLEHDFLLAFSSIRPGIHKEASPVLSLTLKSPYQLPVPFRQTSDLYSAEAGGCYLYLNICLYQGTLKYFYPDYKDYYYLIYEDTAVHKSIGEYVDKAARKKATAQTCYTKKSGLFLPQPAPLWEPALKKQYRDKITYAEYTPALLENTQTLNRYIRMLLTNAC